MLHFLFFYRRGGKTQARERKVDEFLREHPDGVVFRPDGRTERGVSGEHEIVKPAALPAPKRIRRGAGMSEKITDPVNRAVTAQKAIARYQLDLQFHGNENEQGPWRAYQGINCTLGGDLQEGWGSTPTEAVANAVAAIHAARAAGMTNGA